jgi:hypothetical protein
MEININRGFESMLPNQKRPKEKEPQLKNFITFKIFKRRFTLTLEVKEEVDVHDSV